VVIEATDDVIWEQSPSIPDANPSEFLVKEPSDDPKSSKHSQTPILEANGYNNEVSTQKLDDLLYWLEDAKFPNFPFESQVPLPEQDKYEWVVS